MIEGRLAPGVVGHGAEIDAFARCRSVREHPQRRLCHSAVQSLDVEAQIRGGDRVGVHAQKRRGAKVGGGTSELVYASATGLNVVEPGADLPVGATTAIAAAASTAADTRVFVLPEDIDLGLNRATTSEAPALRPSGCVSAVGQELMSSAAMDAFSRAVRGGKRKATVQPSLYFRARRSPDLYEIFLGSLELSVERLQAGFSRSRRRDSNRGPLHYEDAPAVAAVVGWSLISL